MSPEDSTTGSPVTIAPLRPLFAPYHGFFRVAAEADALVLLDAVQFPQGTTWLTRNRFKGPGGELWLTVPVWKKGRGLQRIIDVEICDEGRWRHKHLASLRTAYAHAPFLHDHLPFLSSLYDRTDRLASFNVALIVHLVQALRISTPVVRQSELDIEGRGVDLLIRIARRLGADEIVLPGGAENHVDARSLAEAGVALRTVRTRPVVYPQLWGPFLPDLSVLDMLICCGPVGASRLVRGESSAEPT